MKDWTFSLPTFLAVMSTLGLFFFVTILIFHSVPEETRTPVFALVAVISNAWSIIIGYHFGSSAGSAKKTELLNKNVESTTVADIHTEEKTK